MLWNRCLATSTSFSRVRRCDLRKGHGGEHLSDQGFDQFRWTECWEADDQITALGITTGNDDGD